MTGARIVICGAPCTRPRPVPPIMCRRDVPSLCAGGVGLGGAGPPPDGPARQRPRVSHPISGLRWKIELRERSLHLPQATRGFGKAAFSPSGLGAGHMCDVGRKLWGPAACTDSWTEICGSYCVVYAESMKRKHTHYNQGYSVIVQTIYIETRPRRPLALCLSSLRAARPPAPRAPRPSRRANGRQSRPPARAPARPS